MGSFYPKHIIYQLENDAKFKRKLTHGLRNDVTNFVNFHASSRKFENLHFDRLLLSKAYKVLDEKVQKTHDIEE